MNTITDRLGRLLGITTASLYALYYLYTPTQWHFIDYVDLIFHEAGHAIFMVFGQFISVAMGSGLQILLPLGVALHFFYSRQRLSGATCLMWTGFNFINVSLYAGDAQTLALPLLGGDSVIHDWNYLLSCLGILSYTPLVSGTLYSLGVAVILYAIALSCSIVLKQQPAP